MLLGLSDFNADLFLTDDPSSIFLYYSDFETIPELADIVPLGSFDDETESYLWINLDYAVRLEAAVLFMLRDKYAIVDPITKETQIDREIFMTEFGNIPEVVIFFDQYKDICMNYGQDLYPAPDSWMTWDKAKQEGWYYIINGKNYINWTNYPNWCQTCDKYTYEDSTSKCAYVIPISVIPPADLYYISIIYFNGIYRTNPESVQNFGLFNTLTDIDFEKNKYSLMVDTQKFFTTEFQWFLKTIPGSIPFACDYGTHIKHAVQTKDTEIRRIEIQNEINFFIYNFNAIYDQMVQVQAINILSHESQSGGNSWLIEVEVKIKEETLMYKIEAAT